LECLQERSVALEARNQALESLSEVEEIKATAAAAKAEAAAAAAAAAEWLDKFIKERAVRRKLHEQLQVLLCRDTA
jgi:recombinational DNA repair protein (RecF pathway)